MPEGDLYPLALMARSMVHGIAKLAISGNLPYTSKQGPDFTQCASEAFVSGMGNLKQPGNSIGALLRGGPSKMKVFGRFRRRVCASARQHRDQVWTDFECHHTNYRL